MRKLILLTMFLHVSLFAYTHDELKKDYQEKRYKDVCIKSAVFYKNAEKK